MTHSTSVDNITAKHAEEVRTTSDWMCRARFKEIKRPYSANHVVSLRGTFRQQYASKVQAEKLWKLLKDHQQKKSSSITFGALDPVQVVQMAKYLDTIYVSGWQCSSTASTSNGKFHTHSALINYVRTWT
jgi:isocitrate lyase